MAPPNTKDKWVRRFVISETSRHKKGFTVYKVTSVMFLKTCPDVVSKVSVCKRYSDFKKLHSSIQSLHSSHPEINEPPPAFPKPKFFGRFEAEVIEERRECALKLLEYIGRHGALFSSDVFVKFFESDQDTVSSDTNSEEDRNVIADDVDLPKYACVQKMVKEQKSPGVVIHDGSDLTAGGDQYMLIAAAHMSAAFRHEAIAEYEEAFTQYKLGTSHLINGCQSELDAKRKKVLQDKIRKYLQRAERLYNRHLNCNVSALHKPVTELRNYKIVRLMHDSVMLVKDTLQEFERVIKSVEKSAGCKKDISSYILRGKVPYMVQLYSCMQTDSTVFLVLQYVSRGKMWEYAKSQYKPHQILDSSSIKSLELPSMTEPRVINNLHSRSTPDDMNDGVSELVKNAQKLLQSVNDTLKRSNSISKVSSSLLMDLEEDDDDSSQTNSEPILVNNANKENPEDDDQAKMWCIPEALVKIWGAQILLALEALHQQDAVVCDLRPDNILVDDFDNVCVSYVVPRKDTNELLPRLKRPYSAPELCMLVPPISLTTSADVWSFGVLMYELLTGYDFESKHPGYFHSHSLVNIPDSLSNEAKTLLLNVLKYRPSDRMTIPEIKQEKFFSDVDWLELLNAHA